MLTLSKDEARAKLEQLHAETAAADPFQPAPPIWIAEMHRALTAFAGREQAQSYRLDGIQGINMAFLHRQVDTVLRVLDRPTVRERERNPRRKTPDQVSLPGK